MYTFYAAARSHGRPPPSRPPPGYPWSPIKGPLKETLKRERLEQEQRERAMMEERKRLMAEMENEVALRAQQKVPLLSPRHDSDEEQDEV